VNDKIMKMRGRGEEGGRKWFKILIKFTKFVDG
jgi:hypothetical protein